MTLQTTSNRNDYTGNDSTAQYAYSYRIFSEDDLEVIVTNTTTDVESTLTKSTDYTVAGVGNANGTITLVDAGQAWMSASSFLDTGYKITIKRVVQLTQTTDIRNQGDFYPEAHENEFDKSRMVDQQQQEELDRSVKMAKSVDPANFDATIPASIVGETNITVMTDADGDAFVAGPTASEISSAQTYAIEAKNWARKTDGIVEATDYSSKAYAIGGTGVTDTIGAGASKEWATKTSGTVDTAEYSAKEYAQGTQAGTGGSAKDWANETATDVDSTGEYSAKEYAQGTQAGTGGSAKDWANETATDVDSTGEYSSKEYAIGTQTRGSSGGGSAKDWAQYVDGSNTVDDTEFSSKYYANQAATSAAAAAASAAASQWKDVQFLTNADSPKTIVDGDSGTLFVCDTTSGDVVINLPAISGLSLSDPWTVAFKKSDASANEITINRNGTDTIDGGTSKSVTRAEAGVVVIPDTDPTPDEWTTTSFGEVPITGAIVGDTDTQDLSNKTFTDALTFTEIATPSTPASGDRKIYPKNDGKFYQLDDAGLETEMGAGGGGLDTFHTQDFEIFTAANATGNNATFLTAGTFVGAVAGETSSPLSGLTSGKYTTDGVSDSTNDWFEVETIDLDLKQRDRFIKFRGMVDMSSFSADVDFVIYDKTNSAALTTTGVDILPANEARSFYEFAVYVPSTCTQISYGFHMVNTTTVSESFTFDDFEFSTNPFVYKNLVEITEWVDAGAITIDATTTSPTKPTTMNTDRLRWRRVGDSMEVEMVLEWSSAAGAAAGSGDYLFKMPAGYSIDTTKIDAYSTLEGGNDDWTTSNIVGFGGRRFGTGTDSNLPSAVVVYDENYVRLFGQTNGYRGAIGSAWAPLTAAPSHYILRFTVPITGWSASSEHVVTPAKSGTPAHFVGKATWATGGGSWTTMSDAWTDFGANGSATTPTVEGNVSVPNNQLPAITISNTKSGRYKIIVQGHFASGQTPDSTFRLSDGTNQIGLMAVEHSLQNSTHLIGELSHDGLSDLNIKIQARDHGHTGGDNASVNINTYDRNLEFLVYYYPDSEAASETTFLAAVPVPLVAILKDVKPSGTNGGTFTSGAWQTRTLNTVEGDSEIVSLSSNLFTLPKGKYMIEGNARAHEVVRHKTRIYDVTNSAEAIIGISSYAHNTYIGNAASDFSGVIEISSPTTYQLEHRAETTKTSIGFGVATGFGNNEVYATVKITKLK